MKNATDRQSRMSSMSPKRAAPRKKRDASCMHAGMSKMGIAVQGGA